MSDALFSLIYKVLQYRVEVVRENLRNSFPEKSENQLIKIEIDFYHYFCDFLLQSVKNLTISDQELRSRLHFDNLEVFEKFSNSAQSIIVVMGHFGNWELAGSRFGLEKLHQSFVIYKPQKNKHFDSLFRRMRTRTGNALYTMKGTLRGMIRDKGIMSATVFIADQSSSFKNAFKMNFLGQETRVSTGVGTIASKLNYPVVYASVNRVARGSYRIHLEVLEEALADKLASEISSVFMQRLERDIKLKPETWLWTHRRWKHTRKRK
ncbi:MAG: KDO2-lipid IV(A) lauroyltransferase [Bacteroidia bacterium]|jgi:KDO2-lipid IV(A) lauroyltransferase